MKKTVRIFALALTLALLLSAVPTALAAVTPKAKFEVVDKTEGITTCDIDELGVATLTYENENIVQGEDYAVLVVALNPGFESKYDYTISKDNEDGTLIYIGQINSAPKAGEITFEMVYPIDLKDSVILITGEGLDPTEPVVARIKLNYTLGDVNNDGKITGGDAMLIARYVIGELPENVTFIEEAAKVSKDDRITGGDAMLIARWVIGDITIFPIEE